MSLAGTTISHYRIISRLGAGGMGTVYLAEDIELARNVAIKVLLPGKLQARPEAILRREAQTAAALDHQNICRVYEFDSHGDAPFIAMEYVRGQSLRDEIRCFTSGLPIDRVVALGAQIAAGLGHAHVRGVVHRDVKSANIMIDSTGCVKITDFGIAAMPSDDSTAEIQAPAGTLAYMAPERIVKSWADCRSDLWSLGIVLYEMLTGTLPFHGKSADELMRRIVEDPPPPIAARRPGVPERLRHVITRALAKKPSHRWASASEIENALQLVLGELRAAISDERSGAQAVVIVLPFSNVSADPTNEYFSDGLTEELIYAVGSIPRLRVISRTSAFEFKGRALDVRDLVEKMGVTQVLSGSVRRAGDTVRITAELTDALSGCQVWTGRWDKRLSDVFAIQEDIAGSIAKAFQLSITRRKAMGLHTNVHAYTSYLQGRHCWHQQTETSLMHAFEYFTRAIDEDPACALAYAGLADFYGMLAFWSVASPSEAWPKAREAALKALSLDESLAEAHTSLAYVHLFYDWDFDSAERETAVATQINPSYQDAYYARATYLIQCGHAEEALTAVQRASELDPLSPMLGTSVAWIRYYRREYKRAREECRKALSLDENYAEGHVVLGLVTQELEGAPRAIAHLERGRELTQSNPLVVGVLGAALARAGQFDQARALLEYLVAQAHVRYVAPVSKALIHAGLGEVDAAFDCMFDAVRKRDGLVRYLLVSPFYDVLRDDPRFGELLVTTGLHTVARVPSRVLG